MNTTSNGNNNESNQVSQAAKPTPASNMTSAGVKQQIAVRIVPAIPNCRRCLVFMNHRIASLLLLAAAALAGCSTDSKKHTPQVPGAVTVHCNKSSLRWDACYEAAADLCGAKGYQIISGGDRDTPSVTTNAYEVPVIGDAMMIRCNQ